MKFALDGAISGAPADAALVRLLVRAYSLGHYLASHPSLHLGRGWRKTRDGRALRSAADAPAFLAPDIVVAILKGRQPVALTAHADGRYPPAARMGTRSARLRASCKPISQATIRPASHISLATKKCEVSSSRTTSVSLPPEPWPVMDHRVARMHGHGEALSFACVVELENGRDHVARFRFSSPPCE